MSDLRMDVDTNDLLIKDGDLSLATATDAIQQDLQQTMQLYLGEWFLDTSKGIPYRQLILVKNPNLDVIQALLVNAARSVNGVTDVTAFKYDYDNKTRTLSVTLTAQTTTGDVIKAQASIGATAGAGGQ